MSCYICLCVAGLFSHQASVYLLREAKVSIFVAVTGRLIVRVHPASFKILKDLHANINCYNFGNINKCKLFFWPLQGIYRFPCQAILKFESLKIKETSMAGVKTEPHLEVELMFNQEEETTVNSETSFCVSVGTQCEQTKDSDSIVVKFSCSDSEDAVAGEQDNSQMVSVASFNHCVLTLNLACG